MTVIIKPAQITCSKKAPVIRGFFYIKAFFFLLSTYMKCHLDSQEEIEAFYKKD
jgi:hypothetical protein